MYLSKILNLNFKTYVAFQIIYILKKRFWFIIYNSFKTCYFVEKRLIWTKIKVWLCKKNVIKI